ncbi:peptide ABC transporter substrate-binding protein [Tissierella sp. MSJ-40]|uniref:Peptide ABC transporter substrate-binding protein n=1 Tax=Tissierella simiarum TaxID=2841534 RepID=A0ABS6EAT2_9FIRM|nr:peptide ABC transporter substrate-binding protein [Tissierella simiarum]MBU5440042.1 peptide ABC transporter substrate-binding protein [Tissierella simiarum]
MRYKKCLSLVLIVLIVLTATGCNKDNIVKDNFSNQEDKKEQIEYSPVEGGQIALPLTTFNTLNPLMTENDSYYFFSKLIFESLFEFDSNLNIANKLADSYSIKDGGRVINIKLKDNVLWHDGEKFTAEDVAFTVNTIKYASNDTIYKKIFSSALGSYNNSDISRIMDVRILDNYNIDIVFDRSFSNNLETLTFPIIPKHKFTQGKEDKNAYIKAIELKEYTPIGTGPYKFVSYEKLKTVNLEANENYREGKPYINKVVGKVLENEDLTLTAFETGQIDVTTSIGVDWEKYDQSNRVKILEFVSPNYEFLGFNFNKEIFKGEKGQGLRKAIAYGIDRQSIIQKVYLGHGTQTDVPIHPDSWLISEDSNIYGFNQGKAKEELAKLGFKDTDKDGILEDENGKKLSITLTTNSYNSLRLKAAEMIASDLKKIGIEVIKDFDENLPNNLTEEMVQKQWEQINEKINKGNFDVALLGWRLSVIPELSFAFHTSQIKYNTNIIKYSNETMDQLLVEAFNASTRDDKIKAYGNLQSFITKDLPYVSLFFKNKALLVDKKIIGDMNPNFYNPYEGIEKWYIPKEFQQEN